ncbi:MAG TPA: hypothetical protein VF737_02520 [Gemmatimonadaceae bacterium]
MKAEAGRRVAALVAAGAVMAGCASSGPKMPDENPAIVAAVQAAPRVVQGETTWVTRGPGYDIVAFNRRDIAAVDSAVAHESALYAQMFGAAPLPVVVSVYHRQFDSSSQSFAPGPPLPAGDLETVVEIPLFTHSPRRNGNDDARAYDGGGFGGMGDPTQRVMRAWLSAHASQVLGHAAPEGATGSIDDPRVPAWAEAMLPRLTADDGTVDRLAAALASTNVVLYPVADFMTMPAPQPMYAAGEGMQAGGDSAEPRTARGREGGDGGEGGEGGEGGFGGGRGGFGGMGGFGGRGGFGGGYGGYGGFGGDRGGARRGGYERRPDGARRAMPLRGAALYDAEATVFGHYLLVRQGAPTIGKLVDAALHNQPLVDVLAAQHAGPMTLDALDADFRAWLGAKAERERQAPASGD